MKENGDEEYHEEAIEVDTDASTDGGISVNGNEDEE